MAHGTRRFPKGDKQMTSDQLGALKHQERKDRDRQRVLRHRMALKDRYCVALLKATPVGATLTTRWGWRGKVVGHALMPHCTGMTGGQVKVEWDAETRTAHSSGRVGSVQGLSKVLSVEYEGWRRFPKSTREPEKL